MSFYFHKIPSIVQWLYWKRIWHINTEKKNIYLTFDDGPLPVITPQILGLLSKFQAKVTFFHLGSKIIEHSELHKRCILEGHIVGNHGFDHLNSSETQVSDFTKNIDKGKKIINSNLYRPAYGKLHFRGKSKILKEQKVVMWDIMPGDFDPNISSKQCLKTLLKYSQAGSIIVLHENDKSRDKVLKILPPFLEHFSNLGFSFVPLIENEL